MLRDMIACARAVRLSHSRKFAAERTQRERQQKQQEILPAVRLNDIFTTKRIGKRNGKSHVQQKMATKTRKNQMIKSNDKNNID